MNNELELFGKHIAKLRSKKGLTQEELAEKINYSTNHISKLELARTNPSFGLLVQLASALDVEIEDLFKYKAEKSINDIKKELSYKINNASEKKMRLLYEIYELLD